MSSWVIVIPIVISAASLVISGWVATRNAWIQRAQTRTDLLLRTVDLRLAYANFNRRIRQLREHPPSPLPVELEALLAAETGFRDFERKAETYYLAIRQQKFDVVELEELRLNTESLLKQIDDDNRRLDSILESSPPAPGQPSVGERFSAIKQRVLHLGIINQLPVELSALRVLFIENNMIQRPRFREFFEKWLTRPPVLIGIPMLNAFSGDEIATMQKELAALVM